jgi:hypothetical protein
MNFPIRKGGERRGVKREKQQISRFDARRKIETHQEEKEKRRK